MNEHTKPLYVQNFPLELHEYLKQAGAPSIAAAAVALLRAARDAGWTVEPGQPRVVTGAGRVTQREALVRKGGEE
jgi:hypothetical protein